MDVLVYDNQLAYYELLVTHLSGEYNFVLYSSLNGVKADPDWSAMIFFLHDEVELLDFVKLFSKNVPLLFGISQKDKEDDIVIEDNIYYLHLDKLSDEIIEEVSLYLKMITSIV